MENDFTNKVTISLASYTDLTKKEEIVSELKNLIKSTEYINKELLAAMLGVECGRVREQDSNI